VIAAAMLTNLRLSALPELALPADIRLPFLRVQGDKHRSQVSADHARTC
jgi:hypothetical protein